MTTLSLRAGNLPAEATSFVGRRRELAELRTRLGAGRLVSLVGPGGVGKTRLAIRAATDLSRGFSGGAYLVELAEVRDSALVSNAVLAALDLRDQAASDPLTLLVSYLRHKQLLIVVDNCEHLLEAAAQLVNQVLSSAPGVRVIATSREPLAISGEHVLPIPPLELPAANGAESLPDVQRNDAVTLFVDRAVAASGSFELNSSNRTAVVDICRRLDGLPLAIELAAVRTRVLSVEQIRDRLTDRFALLTGGSRAALPRHQTLRTTIEWSHDLLTREERTFLRRLCVFAGRFTLEDAEAVCAEEAMQAHALDVLSSLVDKSLVIKQDVRGSACYRLHETMREYARLRLREAGEEPCLARIYVDYYHARCMQAATDVRFHMLEWLDWLDLEIENVRSVLQWCLVQADAMRGLTITGTLAWYWLTRSTSEGVHWLDTFLKSDDAHHAERGQTYMLRGLLAVLQADTTAAGPALQQAGALARESGQLRLLSESLAMASVAEHIAGDRVAAKNFLDEAERVRSGLDDHLATVALLQARAINGLFVHDPEAVRIAAEEGVRRGRDTGDLYTHQVMLINLGGAALIAGDLAEAKARYGDALRLARQIDDRVAQFYLLGGLASCAAGGGQARVAAQLFGAAETLRREIGMGTNTILGDVVAQARETATRALGAAKFEVEFTTGAGLHRNDAVRLALGESDSEAAPSSARSSPLREREIDVARLVAEGLSNKQIGTQLLISERTVETHVRGIMNKLGFNSRAQIAGWMASAEY